MFKVLSFRTACGTVIQDVQVVTSIPQKPDDGCRKSPLSTFDVDSHILFATHASADSLQPFLHVSRFCRSSITSTPSADQPSMNSIKVISPSPLSKNLCMKVKQGTDRNLVYIILSHRYGQISVYVTGGSNRLSKS